MPRDKIVRKAMSIRFTKACGLVNKNLHYNSDGDHSSNNSTRRGIQVYDGDGILGFISNWPHKNTEPFILANRAESSRILNSTSKRLQGGAPQGACRVGTLQDCL